MCKRRKKTTVRKLRLCRSCAQLLLCLQSSNKGLWKWGGGEWVKQKKTKMTRVSYRDEFWKNKYKYTNEPSITRNGSIRSTEGSDVWLSWIDLRYPLSVGGGTFTSDWFEVYGKWPPFTLDRPEVSKIKGKGLLYLINARWKRGLADPRHSDTSKWDSSIWWQAIHHAQGAKSKVWREWVPIRDIQRPRLTGMTFPHDPRTHQQIDPSSC